MKKIMIVWIVLVMWVMLVGMGVAYAAEIQSMKITKTGSPTVQFSPYNDMIFVERPVMVQVTYRCSSNGKWSITDIEAEQSKDKWGEWIISIYNMNDIREKLENSCNGTKKSF